MMKADNLPEKKICEACRKEFSCGANVGQCWCFEVKVEADQLIKLKEDFTSCLCQDCLLKQSKSNNQSVQ